MRTDHARTTAFVAGTLYLVTFVSSIPAALYLLTPVLDDPGYILGAGSDTRVLWGCLLDVVNAFAGIGTAVALFPVMKKYGESAALGFVTSRTIEAAVVMIGVVSLLGIVTLKQNGAGADPDTMVATGRSLVAVRDWTLLLGPGLMPAFSALLLGSLMYRSRLVPRIIPMMGLVGGPLLMASVVGTLFGHVGQFSSVGSLLALPVAAWELSLGSYLVVKGFKPVAAASREPVLVA
jgi:hypothetical protein